VVLRDPCGIQPRRLNASNEFEIVAVFLLERSVASCGDLAREQPDPDFQAHLLPPRRWRNETGARRPRSR
jgi:hypothetical protein